MTYFASVPLWALLLSPSIASWILPSSRSFHIKVWIRIMTFQQELGDTNVDEIKHEKDPFLFVCFPFGLVLNSQGGISNKKNKKSHRYHSHSTFQGNGKHNHSLYLVTAFPFFIPVIALWLCSTSGLAIFPSACI